LKTRLFILILLCSFQGRAEVYPFTLSKGFVVTEAVIEGQNVLVILDSGAPGLVLNEKYYHDTQDSIVLCSGIYGDFECNTQLVKRWEWLGITNRNTTAIVSDLSFLERLLGQEIHALIGLSAIAHFYVAINYDQETIGLEKERNDIPAASFSRFQYVNHLPVLPCKVNGEKKFLGLDTGSECNFLFNYTASADPGLLASSSPIIIVGTDNKENVKQRIMLTLELSNEETGYPSEFIVDLDDQEKIRHAGFDGMLGQPFLTEYNIIIHPGKQRILLIPRFTATPLAAAVMP
jgi:hypothetical protein